MLGFRRLAKEPNPGPKYSSWWPQLHKEPGDWEGPAVGEVRVTKVIGTVEDMDLVVSLLSPASVLTTFQKELLVTRIGTGSRRSWRKVAAGIGLSHEYCRRLYWELIEIVM